MTAPRPMTVERTVVVARPAEDVFDLVADVGRRPEWLGELDVVISPDEPAHVGTRFVGRTRIFWHEFLGASEITRSERGRGLAEEIYLGAHLTSEWTFTATGEGHTEVRHRIAIDYPNGLFGRFERWIVRRRLRALQRRSLGALGRASADEAGAGG